MKFFGRQNIRQKFDSTPVKSVPGEIRGTKPGLPFFSGYCSDRTQRCTRHASPAGSFVDDRDSIFNAQGPQPAYLDALSATRAKAFIYTCHDPYRAADGFAAIFFAGENWSLTDHTPSPGYKGFSRHPADFSSEIFFPASSLSAAHTPASSHSSSSAAFHRPASGSFDE
jgi:hypothetical protein